ncbi:hypothetical protein NE686_18055 [Tissierella carlieri]|uniref:Uncharacterized protein n=1 Tax=Tissierella carlieri TaxID=689904 RepID=A0ABT1SEU9_9FIRM|nr:hypothetical protein [Tissierella carlieri]MCQ4925010.1 hypothetical protein [Tissierella carlieri]
MTINKKNVFSYIDPELIDHYYSISYRCGYKDFISIFSLYIENEIVGSIEDNITLNSFKEFCISNRELNYNDSSITEEFIKISNRIERKFKDIDLLVYNKGVIDNSVKESIPLEMAQIKKWEIDKHINSLMAEVNKNIKAGPNKPRGIESLYFIRNFNSIDEALKYVRIKTVDGFMIEGTEKVIEDIVYRGYVENLSPFMAYYVYYKFPLLFDEKIILLEKY